MKVYLEAENKTVQSVCQIDDWRVAEGQKRIGSGSFCLTERNSVQDVQMV